MLALHLIDRLLLSHDRSQRRWLAQSVLAWLLMGVAVAVMSYAASLGVVAFWVVWCWGAMALGGLAVAFLVIRTGLSRHWRDPALTVPQMGLAIACSAMAYGMAGSMRGSVLPTLLVVFMFGLFNLPIRVVVMLSAYALATLAGVMGWMAWRAPDVFSPVVEATHFVMLLSMLPALIYFGCRLGRERASLAECRAALGLAQDKVQGLTLRDASTGLFTQRHMQMLLEADLKRRARCGPSFSLALIEPDHESPAGDEPWLRTFAELMPRTARGMDIVSRWGERGALLLLPQTGHTGAIRLLERLRRRARRLPALAGTPQDQTPTFSVGLTDSQVDDSVSAMLTRLQQAVDQARRNGGNRIVYGEPG